MLQITTLVKRWVWQKVNTPANKWQQKIFSATHVSRMLSTRRHSHINNCIERCNTPFGTAVIAFVLLLLAQGASTNLVSALVLILFCLPQRFFVLGS